MRTGRTTESCRSAKPWPWRKTPASTCWNCRRTPILQYVGLDHGKFKYEEQKRKNEARKKQKTIEVKEIKFRPNIDDHDYGVKMRSMVKFLEEGDKVKVTLRFRGRELRHQELGTASWSGFGPTPMNWRRSSSSRRWKVGRW